MKFQLMRSPDACENYCTRFRGEIPSDMGASGAPSPAPATINVEAPGESITIIVKLLSGISPRNRVQ